MQNKVPKVDKATMAPAEWATNKHLEWCPPGHGDLYTSLYGSGKLDELLADGVKYMFVSNSDNLGATLDLDLLTYFAGSNAPFLMECCRRTEADKKGERMTYCIYVYMYICIYVCISLIALSFRVLCKTSI
jgi:UDP-N-acetylglucosamine pyrophosphorylase